MNFQKATQLIANGNLRLIAELSAYRLWRRFHGLDFEFASLSELGLDPERSVQHENGGGPLLRGLLRQLGITESDAALDLGCGKGGAMATLAAYPFRAVGGVEISPALAGVARENLLAKLRLTKCRVFQADAATFTDLDEYTYIFLYNPFPAAVLEQVIANLSDSLFRRPRLVRIVYVAPFHEEVILGSDLFRRSFDYQPYPEYRVCVYEGGASGGSWRDAPARRAGHSRPVRSVLPGGDFALARYTTSGELDPSFGSSGKVLTHIGRNATAVDMAIQKDGTIVVADTSGIDPVAGGGDFALARYTTSGELDASFGSGRKVLSDLGGADMAAALAVQMDGKIVAVGISS